MFSSRKSAAPAAGGYTIAKSLRFRSSASAYLNRTPASAGNRQTATFSWWMKRGALASYQAVFSLGAYPTNLFEILFLNDDTIYIQNTPNSTTRDLFLQTTQVFRDPSAWYHFILAIDTTQATSSNRAKLYVNGVQVTSFQSPSYPSQNTNLNMNTAVATQIGRRADGNYYQDAYLAEFNFIDGQALTPTSFGATDAATGVWQPIKYTGTYGTNGFYLKFTDTTSTSTLGNDSSGNNNTWTTNNISLTSGETYDSMTDVPTNTSATVANYPVLNRLIQNSYIALGYGNLSASSTTNDVAFVASTMTMTSGNKYYFELRCQTNIGANFYQAVGIWATRDFSSYGGTYTTYFNYNASDGTFYNGSGSVSYGATWTNGDVIGVAVDLVNGTLTFYKNNVSQGVAKTGIDLTLQYYADVYLYTTSASINFGQQPFTYTPPSGYVALNTFNLPTPTIGATASTVANKYFDISLYTGNGSTQTITNSGSMQPDFVWAKVRSTGYSHRLVDSVRGATKLLYSDLTNAEATDANSLTSFNSNGFSLGNAAGTNDTSQTFVAWQWRASNTTAVTNTSGSITSTVSANTTAGFSIVTYTGNGTQPSTVGHGLGVAPSMVIVKPRNTGIYDWNCYHISLGNTQYIALNTTAAASSAVSVWNNTTPTSTVFTINHVAVNTSTTTYVAYCFAQVAGYSAFGSYVGNSFSAGADGTFVYLGFRPRFVLVKLSSSSGYDWVLYDSARSPTNVTQNYLNPSTANSENAGGTVADIDFLSNGFKLRNNSTSAQGTNIGNQTYIYAAFAESPFKYANAR